jgi:hypothetical protein
MTLEIAPYAEQVERWPREGRHLLAQYDDASVVVYQAYRPSIARFAAEHGYFGGDDFSFSRMSWIKPNFLWMMFRCGWATKPGQERVLAIRLRRSFFDDVLARAVASSWDRSVSREEWQRTLKASDVRLQWDPDHDPSGAPVARRAIQLGLRGSALAGFRGEAIAGIDDITSFVIEQRDAPRERLMTPLERVYPITDARARRALGLEGE